MRSTDFSFFLYFYNPLKHRLLGFENSFYVRLLLDFILFLYYFENNYNLFSNFEKMISLISDSIDSCWLLREMVMTCFESLALFLKSL